MDSSTIQGEGHDERGHLAEISKALAESASNLRTIKIVLIFYALIALLVSVGSTVWIMSGQLARTIREQVESAEPTARPMEDRSNSPSRGDSAPTIDPPSVDGGSESPVFRVGNEVQSPRLLSKIEPGYSKEARAAKLEGSVLLAVEVWEDGIAHNIRVVRSLGLGLDENAIDAVKKWRFSPGTKDGEPVRVAARIEVKFRLL